MEGRVTVTNFKTDYKASVIKSVDHNTDQWTRIKSPETDLQICRQLISEKLQKRKNSVPNN